MAKPVDEYDHGEPIPYDPDFNGPLRKRSCTDILCLMIFLVFIGAWIGIGIYAYTNGNPSTLLVPRDTLGRRCGRDTDVLNKPYLLFHDITKCLDPSTPFTGCKTPQVCVSSCPSEFKYYLDRKTNDCGEYLFEGTDCPPYVLPSTSLQKRCIPNVAKIDENMLKQIGESLGNLKKAVNNIKLLYDFQEIGQNVIEDLIKCWWKIAIGVVIALVVCLFYIFILRWFAGPLVWLSIIGVVIGLGAGLYFSIVQYKHALNDLADNAKTQYEEEKELREKQLKTTKDLWLTCVVIVAIVLVVILLILLVLRKRIVLAITLIKEGSKAVGSVTAALFFPILPWILQFGVIAYSIAVGIYLATVGKPLYKTRYYSMTDCYKVTGLDDDVVCNPDDWSKNDYSRNPLCGSNATCKFIRMNNDVMYPYLQAYNIFAFFWLLCFVIALGQMVLAGVFAQWYWTFKKSRLPFFAVTSAFARTLRYHIGTLAFGSLIIAICKLIRLFLEYVDHKVKKYDNDLTKAIMCIFKCFFYCLEKFLRFLNKNAYIMCSIHGKNFCVSAKDAFMLLMRNILRVWVLDKITDFLFFLSKVLLTLGVGAASYVFFASGLLPTKVIDNSDLHYGIVPVAVIMICTYFISSLFFNVYSMAVDTLFLCFLEDCERNDGSPEKPYYMSKSLMKIFGKKNKID
ncbi:choline transporter-like 2 isoform X3 [Diabrotica virgifera virgifera]|uniref:Choline transporter-like protein n=1 Tax=Diabrotica virgifera virgifera TaxID=50390 RepID=A0A6P7FU65_DIAVI|nr:choline transporter-like 2 isoform X3 [Diabrotica virgifera virgifera]